MRNDRLIKIFVGDQDQPYLIPETTLVNQCAVFEKFLKHENEFGHEPGVLRFPEDNVAAWEQLLYFMINGDTGDFNTPGGFDHDCNTLVHCYILGDKYNLEDFQGSIMYNLQLLKEPERFVSLDTVKLGFMNTPPRSRLRGFLADEVAAWANWRGTYKKEDLDVMDGAPGFIGEFLEALGRLYRYGSQSRSERVRRREHDKQREESKKS